MTIKELNNTKQWVKDAVADGWLVGPVYKSESVGTAAKLEKEGFSALAIMRVREKDGFYETDISVWGPDGLSVNHSEKYSWEYLQKELRHCQYCNKEDVDTTRISFAGRCCMACRPELRKTYEKPGWYD